LRGEVFAHRSLAMERAARLGLGALLMHGC
jgi:hypothetical protein